MSRLLKCAALPAVGVLLLIVPALASAAAPAGDVAMYSDPGDFIGGGSQNVYTSANTTFSVSGNTGYVTVSVSSTTGDSRSLVFAAAPGENLAPGVYTGAARAEFRQAGQPGIDISGDGRGCNTDTGQFQVKDIATDSSGAITRLWIIYEQHCEGAAPALFGDVRLGEPASRSPLSIAPAGVRWPAYVFGETETTVPVQVTATRATTVGSVRLAGPQPSQFKIALDTCTGQALRRGQVCDVYVQPTPTAPGAIQGQLVVAPKLGLAAKSQLQAWSAGGTTKVSMSSQPGDWVGQGLQYNFALPTDSITAYGTTAGVFFTVNAGSADSWSGDFTAPPGDILAPGTTFTGAERYPFQGTAPGLSVTGDSRGCNMDTGQFTVNTATYSPSGQMETFGVTFTQDCDGDPGQLQGTFDWLAGDTTPPPPWW